MMCPECGSFLDGKTVFCPACGCSLLTKPKYRIGPGDFIQFRAEIEVMNQELWDGFPAGSSWSSFVPREVVNLIGDVAIVPDGRNVVAKVNSEEFDVLPVLDNPQSGFVSVEKTGEMSALVSVTTY